MQACCTIFHIHYHIKRLRSTRQQSNRETIQDSQRGRHGAGWSLVSGPTIGARPPGVPASGAARPPGSGRREHKRCWRAPHRRLLQHRQPRRAQPGAAGHHERRGGSGRHALRPHGHVARRCEYGVATQLRHAAYRPLRWLTPRHRAHRARRAHALPASRHPQNQVEEIWQQLTLVKR